MKFGMTISPVEGETYYECEADSKEEAERMGQDYANSNFCYVVDKESIERIDKLNEEDNE